MSTEVSTGVVFDDAGEVLGAGVSIEVGLVMKDVEKTVSSGWVAMGVPSGSTKVIAG